LALNRDQIAIGGENQVKGIAQTEHDQVLSVILHAGNDTVFSVMLDQVQPILVKRAAVSHLSFTPQRCSRYRDKYPSGTDMMRYSAAVARAMATRCSLLDLVRIRYCLVSSTTAMTLTTLVSLNRATRSLVMGGMMTRMAWGRMMRRNVSGADMPSE